MSSGSSFGTLYRVTTFGESHCAGVGAIVDGCPPGLNLTEDDLQTQLTRRRPGQSKVNTPRDEKDRVTILSGTENGVTLGTPIGLLVANEDQRPKDYGEMNTIPRPSHADYTYQMKYGVRASSGGGRSSARETIGRVAAGAIAEKWLRETFGVEIVAWVSACGEIEAQNINPETIRREEVDANIIRCPDLAAADTMIQKVTQLRDEGDSIGGVLTCVARNVPAGWGEPVFDKLEAKLAQAMMSIPATKGFEVGTGFAAARMTGSDHNDPFVMKGTRLGTLTNHSGGIQGGISNGEPILFRLAIKPPATISKAQSTADFDGTPQVLAAKGRHDPFVVNRAVPIVETMAALVLMDMALIQQSRVRPGRV
ncbi:MAG: chorismate synthase [Verrucomicrobia bacterium]|nr:chorismate synthase [Verrucomicrobiota bacterium]MCH8512167.1 chorismate synthase [Kiritimatiellia bacterium]